MLYYLVYAINMLRILAVEYDEDPNEEGGLW